MPDAVGTYALPLIYDIIHAPGTAGEVSALIRIARRCLARRGRAWSPRDVLWVEPGSGTGRYVRRLTARGCRCVGVDISREMVEFARGSLRDAAQRGLAKLIVGDMRRMDAPALRSAVKSLGGSRPIVAFCPHNSVRHLQSDADLIAHLRGMGRLMSERGGIYLVGIGLAGPGGERDCETVACERRSGVSVREVINFVMPAPGAKGRTARGERAFKHVSVSDRRGESDFISRYVLRTYTLEQWRRVVRRSGLVEIGVAGGFGERFESDRLHYAYRVLAPVYAAPAGGFISA